MTIEEIKKRKRELGWTNAELAKKAGIPVSTVAKILGGTTQNPRQSSVRAMEEALLNASPVTYHSAGSPSVLREQPYVYGTSARKNTGHRQYTIDDYFALPDDRRVELIDGRFYDMASPTGIHQIVLFRIWKALDACIEEHGMSCTVQGAPFDVQLFDDPYTVVQPDVMVFCTKPEEAKKDRAHSAPDFIAEILSPPTAFRDRTQKLCRYRDAGVKEVWLVSPYKKKIWVYRFYAGKEEPDEYTFHDKVPLGISDHRCAVDFAKISKYM